MKKSLRVGTTILTVYILAASTVMAQTTWIVDKYGEGSFTTIQSCIDGTSVIDGDTCQVNSGTYIENINFSGKNITIKSTAGPVFTTIDGNASGSVVTFENGETVNAVLDGFSIRNGSATYGGGIICIFSSPTVTNCIISNNTSAASGGGMRNTNAHPTVSNCIFTTNQSPGGYGGGMSNYNSSPTVTNCTFFNNLATSGGGMGNYGYNNSGTLTVTNCTFWGNTATEKGGGMWNHTGRPTVTNCTFWGNTATVRGGGISNEWHTQLKVTNCILWGDFPDEVFESDDGSTQILTFTYSDIQGEFLVSGDHNINADPLFLDSSAGNFRLQQGSPCIDAGDNSAMFLPANDFEGDDRIIDGNHDGTATVDMGIDECRYEFPWEMFYPAFIKKK